jgi:hypothetical protein
MKHLGIALILFTTLVCCTTTKNENSRQDNIEAIVTMISGVFVDKGNDSTLFYFEEFNDSSNEYIGFVSHDFSLDGDGFTINRLHEDQLRLFIREEKIFVRFIPFFGDSEDIQLVIMNENQIKLGDNELRKVKGFE